MLKPGSPVCQPNTSAQVSTRISGWCCARGRQKNARPLWPGIHRISALLQLGSIVVTITIAVMLHVIHGATIAFLKAFAEFSTILSVDRRAFENVVIVCVGVTVIHVVTAGRFYAFTESLTLWVAIAIRGAIPVAIAILVLILRLRSAGLRGARGQGRFLCRCFDRCGCGDAEGKSWNREPFYVHKICTSRGHA